MTRTQLTGVAVGLAAMCAVGLSAQTQETQTTTKTTVEIKGGKNVTVYGCLERGTHGDYLLSQVGHDSRVEPSRYTLVTSQDLNTHVGQRVEIKGKAVTNGDGKVSIESKTKTEVENGKDQESKTKTEGTGGTLDLPYLGVQSIKTISLSCR
jgi:hypothetical protein